MVRLLCKCQSSASASALALDQHMVVRRVGTALLEFADPKCSLLSSTGLYLYLVQRN